MAERIYVIEVSTPSLCHRYYARTLLASLDAETGEHKRTLCVLGHSHRGRPPCTDRLIVREMR